MRITDCIHEDHEQLRSYHDRIVHAPSEDEQTRYQNQLVWELARHVVGEDLVVYPALEKFSRDGASDRQMVSGVLHFIRASFNSRRSRNSWPFFKTSTAPIHVSFPP